MKSIMLFIISIIICIGCEINYDFGGKPYVPPEPPCKDNYKATISVKYENGAPCTTAWSMTNPTPHWQVGTTADTAGMLNICIDFNCDVTNPDTLVFPDTVYHTSSQEITLWGGEIPFVKINDDTCPDPFVEIVVPDSLVP